MLHTLSTNSKHRNMLHKEDSGESTEMTLLRPRGNGSSLPSYTKESTQAPPSNVVYLEREIMPTDTLQSFALLYGCTINDIKRANCLINEQDFFTLCRLKIPVKRHGLLTEQEEELKRRPNVSSSLTSTNIVSSTHHKTFRKDNYRNASNSLDDVYHNTNEEFESEDSLDSHNLLGSQSRLLSKDSAIDCNNTSKFLKNVDKEIRKTIKSNEKLDAERNDVLEEVVSSMGSVGYHPLPFPGSQKEYNGASWGVKWSTLIICFILLLIIVFFFVIVKIYMKGKL